MYKVVQKLMNWPCKRQVMLGFIFNSLCCVQQIMIWPQYAIKSQDNAINDFRSHPGRLNSGQEKHICFLLIRKGFKQKNIIMGRPMFQSQRPLWRAVV